MSVGIDTADLLKDFTVEHMLYGPDKSKITLDAETTTMVNDVLTWILFEVQRVSLKIDFRRVGDELSKRLSGELSSPVKIIEVQQMEDHLHDRVCFGFVLQTLSYEPIQAKSAPGIDNINFQ